MADSALSLQGICFEYGSRAVLTDIALSLPAGTFTTLLGASGSGKSTLLQVIAGHQLPSGGQLMMMGQNITHRPAEQRGIGMVFQSYALFPHLSARDNVAFGLRMRRLPRSVITQRVEAILDLVQLSPLERGRLPSQLSGGQQQRVALARALVIEPTLLLLDEPFANLDRMLREQLRDELRTLQQRTGVTTLMVTHDRDDAMSLSDQIGLMHLGRIVQCDTPQRIYHEPINAMVARLLGPVNEIADGDGVQFFRPEAVRVVPGTGWKVRACEFRGAEQLVHLQGVTGQQWVALDRENGRYSVGAEVALIWVATGQTAQALVDTHD